MTKTMVGIKILEMTQTGLHEVVELETEEPLTDPERQQAALSVITEMAYENDKMFLVVEDKAFVIRGLDKKTIVVKGVFKIESGPSNAEMVL